jgi:hypothetical protein
MSAKNECIDDSGPGVFQKYNNVDTEWSCQGFCINNQDCNTFVHKKTISDLSFVQTTFGANEMAMQYLFTTKKL